MGQYATDSETLQAAQIKESALARRTKQAEWLIAEISTSDADEIAQIELAVEDSALWQRPELHVRRAAVRRFKALHASLPEGQRGAVFQALIRAQDRLRRHRDHDDSPTRAIAAFERQTSSVEGRLRTTVQAFIDGMGLGATSKHAERQRVADEARARVDQMLVS